ncbi:DUF3515 domain-containing protein [Nocardioides baculatus]|uniref:DUF3515 domain-containing protein n=1 Tax=Nocardioides baculatus TaxID=2801337 RepID=A0ABS1L6K3_9ACTN|nr:DUF3515 domain-containing protein [Nocardioides baculatus]MBL0747315.1 DUF3515 domain-containing protein [Nocardioides baculatus]
MHVRRRLGPRWGRGVVASAAVLVLTSCSPGTISIDDHDLSDSDRATCEALVDDLPDTIGGELRRSVDADGGPGAAWGDPAYVLTCGVPEPSDYEPTAECSDIKGVGWWVPDDELDDLSEDAHAVALSRTPYVEVLVPSRYRTDGIDRALADLAPAMKEHLADGRPCL